jgi:hypothetical protein
MSGPSRANNPKSASPASGARGEAGTVAQETLRKNERAGVITQALNSLAVFQLFAPTQPFL